MMEEQVFVQARIGVMMDTKGNWCAVGDCCGGEGHGQSDDEIREAFHEATDRTEDRLYFVTFAIPVTQEEIAGTVE